MSGVDGRSEWGPARVVWPEGLAIAVAMSMAVAGCGSSGSGPDSGTGDSAGFEDSATSGDSTVAGDSSGSLDSGVAADANGSLDSGNASDASVSGDSSSADSGGGDSSSTGDSGAAGDSGSKADSGGAGMPPGDIATAAATPLVAAHSMTRALYAAYGGNLFQVRRASDSKTQDIAVTGPGGYVDMTALTTFCSGTTCTVSILYDQSGNANDLPQATAANQPAVEYWMTSQNTKVPMAVTVNKQWLRNRANTHKIPTGAASQTEYMVVHAAYYNGGCCYDYGNMENPVGDDGPGTMNALYFGNSKGWTWGAGNGPWAMVDMENGLFAGGGNIGEPGQNQNDPTIAYPGNNIATVLSKTNGTSTFVLKAGDAATGALNTYWNGSLPTLMNPTSYIPLHQQGGLSLGEGGDGSNSGTGAFSEGVVIAAETTDATDNLIQSNLNAVYGR